jgi:hypothetical protein
MGAQVAAESAAARPASGSDRGGSTSEAEAHVGYFPSLTQTQRRWLATRLDKLDRGAGCSGAAPSGAPEQEGLYAFQNAAAEWLCGRFRGDASRRGYSLVEMEAGCGKTRAVGAFIQRAAPRSARVMWLTQGGLVRQTREELAKVVSGLPCLRAESTREFNKHLSAGEPGAVLVVNVALSRAWLAAASDCWCIVLDEAHRLSAAVVSRLAARVASASLVFLSGTPTAGSTMATLSARAADAQHFVFQKRGDVTEKLQMPRVTLGDAAAQPAASPHAAGDVIQRLFLTAPSTTGPLLGSLLLCAPAELPHLDAQGQERAWDAAARAWRHAMLEYPASARSHLARRLQHPAISPQAWQLARKLEAMGGEGEAAAQALAELLERQLPERSRRHAEATEAAGQRDGAGAAAGRPPRAPRATCACCGLQPEELLLWHGAIAKVVHAPRVPLPEAWDFGSAPFVRGILRFPWAFQVEEYRQRTLDQQCGPHGSVSCYFVSSELSAAQRASRVRNFSRPRESPAALRMLQRSGLGPPGSAAARISSIGAGCVLNSILDMVADRAILVCDARCGDVGYNLQCTTHILCPLLPRSSDDVRQLCGRAERIRGGGRGERPEVCVVCLPRAGTGELTLLKHLRAEVR